MGEYEPEDSRIVTQSTHQAPGEPPRTGPREDQARQEAKRARDEDNGIQHEVETGQGRAPYARPGQMEQDIGTAGLEQGRPLGSATEGERGETAADPSRLRGDPERRPGGS